MSDSLKNRVIKLAYTNEDLRQYLLPIIKANVIKSAEEKSFAESLGNALVPNEISKAREFLNENGIKGHGVTKFGDNKLAKFTFRSPKSKEFCLYFDDESKCWYKLEDKNIVKVPSALEFIKDHWYELKG